MYFSSYVYFVFLLYGRSRCDKIPLYVGCLYELTELPEWYEKAKFFPYVIDYALEMIHTRMDILEQYHIQTVVKDVKFWQQKVVLNIEGHVTQTEDRQCILGGGYGSQAIIELLETEPKKVAILGPAHSTILSFTGQIAPIYNVVEMFYGEATPKISNSKLYPTLFNVNQMTKELNFLRIEIMKYFGWSRVGTIAHEGDNWEFQIDHFHELLLQNNMTLVSSAVLTSQRSVREIIRSFKQFDVRIFMIAVNGKTARDVFCEAYYRGLYGNGYVWVISGPTLFDDINIVATADDTMACTKDELIQASNGHFLVNYKYVSDSQDKTISGKTPQHIMAEIIDMNSKSPYPLDAHVGVVFDTVWALSLGLNSSIKYLDEKGLSLHEYNYTHEFLDSVKRGMHEVHFNGVSGPVSFNEEGNRIGVTYLQQSYNDSRSDIAIYDPNLGNITWLVQAENLWPGQSVPKDRFIYQELPVSSSSVAFAVVTLTDIAGFVLSFTFLAFNVYHRNNSTAENTETAIWYAKKDVMKTLIVLLITMFIKMSSPMLNNVIIVGSLLMYIEVLLNAIDYSKRMDRNLSTCMCMILTWLKSIGFTTLFGALFAKTYRVYVIFRNDKLKRKIVRDVQLFLLIGAMLMIDLLILVPWSAVDPLFAERHSNEVQDRRSDNIIFSQAHVHCTGSYQIYWIATLYVYKGLLLAFGMFLAWETRQVNVPALNDSKYIGACIYNVVIVCIFGVPLAHVLPTEQSTLSFVLESCLILFCTIICLCIIFIPKIQMRNQVHGRFVTEQMTSRMNTRPNMSVKGFLTSEAGIPNNTNRTMDGVTEENRSLRLQIAAESIAIARLRKSLIQMTGNVHFYKSGSDYVLFKTDGPSSSRCDIGEHSE